MEEKIHVLSPDVADKIAAGEGGGETQLGC